MLGGRHRCCLLYTSLLEYAKQFGKPELIEKAQTIFDNAIRAGWDEEYGGLLYFVDAKMCIRDRSNLMMTFLRL